MTLTTYLKEVREIESKATPGDWTSSEPLLGDSGQWACVQGYPRHSDGMRHMIPWMDAQFIAYMRNNTLRLVGIIERMQDALISGTDKGGVFWREIALQDADRIASEGN